MLYFLNPSATSKNYLSNQEYYLSVLFAGNIFYDYYLKYYSQDISVIMNYIYFLKQHIKTAKSFYIDFFNYFLGKIITNNNLPFEMKLFLMKYFRINENCDSYKYLNIANNSFLNINSSSKYNNKKMKSPNISIIIINSNNTLIKRAINLFRIQNFEYQEIIIISNNTMKTKIFEDHNQLYSKIKLIKEKDKIGYVNSISKAVLMAKAKYVMIFNPLCSFKINDTLENIFLEIEKKGIDILEFDLYERLSNNYLILYKCKHSESKFNLTQIKYNLDEKNVDINKELLSNKIIKTEYFKKIINIHRINEINEIIDFYYNELIYFSLESIPHKFLHVNTIKLYLNETDFDNIKFNDFSSQQSNIINDAIYYINFIFDHSKNTLDAKKEILNEYLNLLNIIYNKYINISESAINLYKKFVDCKYISEDNKSSIEFYIKSLRN